MKSKLLVLGLCLLIAAGAYSEPVARGAGVIGAGVSGAQTDSLETGAFVLVRAVVPNGMSVSDVRLLPTMGEIRFFDGATRYLVIDKENLTIDGEPMDNAENKDATNGEIKSAEGKTVEVMLVLPEQNLKGSDVAVLVVGTEPFVNQYGTWMESQAVYTAMVAGEKLESGGVYIWETQPVKWEYINNNLNVSALYQTNITSQVGSGEYSGITYISGNQYAVVHDKLNGGGLTLFDIPLYPDGSVGRISKSVPAGTSESAVSSRDNEGVAYVNGKLFISAEADQSIREYTLQGKETGRALAVPSDLSPDKIQGNAGFEALTYNAKTERFWTVTEKPLLADENFQYLLRLQSFGKNLKPAGRALYLMMNPNKSEDEVSGAYAYVHGVPALAELDDGRLIVLEREVYVPNGNVLVKALGARTWTKLYLVDPVNDKSGILRKSLLTSFITSSLNLANFEGMCLGPKLEDGSQVLILIADSQNGSGGLTKEYIKVLLIR
ncbi:MAG: esterase-like activity of phytase family protein [Bacteroidales bacterium]|nr:esterase-like activity of phytase family protein [Bacteroidales bacterium]